MSFGLFRIVCTAMAFAALAGCQGGDDHPLNIAVIGDPADLSAARGRMPLAAQIIRASTSEGLVGFDEQGRVVPALADRWIVTDDGMSYIFRLRDGAWPNGDEITGESSRQALEQAIGAVRSTSFGLDLASIREIRAMAGRVVEIRLTRQTPDLLQLLAQPELGMQHRGRGAGPMKLTRRNDGVILKPIAPEDRGLPQIEGWSERIRRLQLAAVPARKAIERFNQGDTDVVLGGRFEDFPRLDASSVSRGAIRLDPVVGLFGLAVVHSDGFLSQSENREAIAMAIDRDALGTSLGIGGWAATTRIVTPGLEGDNGTVGERWPGRDMTERRALALARVERWRGSEKGQVVLRIALPQGPGADALFARLSQDLGAIGLKVRRVSSGAQAELRLVDAVSRYAHAGWYVNQLSCQGSNAPCSVAADRYAHEALNETDPVKRSELYSQAEAQLTIANTYIPFGVPIRWSLVGGGATGFAANSWSVHPLMPMAMRPK